MAAVVAAHTSESMGKITAVQELFYHLGHNRPPETILPLIPFIIDLYKLLKMISDALIEWRFLIRTGAVYSKLFGHFKHNESE